MSKTFSVFHIMDGYLNLKILFLILMIHRKMPQCQGLEKDLAVSGVNIYLIKIFISLV